MAADTRDPQSPKASRTEPQSNLPPPGPPPSSSSPSPSPSSSHPTPHSPPLTTIFPTEPIPMPTPPQNANTLPLSASQNTAGAHPEHPTRPPTILETIQSISPSDFKQVHKKPCVRDALLFGMGAGFGLGGLRFILLGGRRTMWSVYNWTIGTFCLGSAGMYEFCQRRRKLEMAGMARAVEIVERKKVEKEREVERRRGERRLARERMEKEEEEERNKGNGMGKGKGWLGFWS